MHDVATAQPDGYTIGQGVNSIFTITRISGTNVPFTLDDFTLLGNYATDVSVLAVSGRPPALLPCAWRLDLDDIGTEPGQGLATRGPRLKVRQVEHPDPGQGRRLGRRGLLHLRLLLWS